MVEVVPVVTVQVLEDHIHITLAFHYFGRKKYNQFFFAETSFDFGKLRYEEKNLGLLFGTGVDPAGDDFWHQRSKFAGKEYRNCQ